MTGALCALLSARGSFDLQAQAALPRLPDGHPDLQGLWMKSAGGFQGLFIGSLDGTNFAAGCAEAAEDVAAAAVQRRPSIRTRRGGGGAGRPPETRLRRSRGALPSSGVPRALDQPGGLYPVQIIQDEKSVALLHEAMHDVRIIPTDNSPHPRNYWAWDGDSRGRWDGDTLVVDVSNFNGRTWLDMQANFVDENEHVVERFSLVDRDTIQYEATITDPTVFVRPIQMRFTLKRVPAEQQILEYSCLEGERSLQHYTDEDGGRKRRAQ